MRHRSKTVKLQRDKAHREALLRNLAASLIEHGQIRTTLAKAAVDALVTGGGMGTAGRGPDASGTSRKQPVRSATEASAIIPALMEAGRREGVSGPVSQIALSDLAALP